MAFKITFSKELKALIKKEGLIKQVHKEFAKKGPIKVKQAIIKDMITGLSPVLGKGKWKTYSVSYKQAIKGEAFLGEDGEWFIFRHVGGKVRKIIVDEKKLSRNPLQEKASPTKAISPVNLRLTGALHKSLKTRMAFFSRSTLIIQFKNKLADIHNRLGAGKAKVIRRLLPTNKGERFNRTIEKVIIAQLNKAADIVAKRFTRQ